MSNANVREKVYANDGNPEVLRWVPSSARRILDLGCGAGGNAAALAGRVERIDGVTLSEGEAIRAREICNEVFVHNLEEGLPLGTQAPYDTVLASHVLEHLCFPEKLLRDVAEQLTPGGTLIVALPNLMNFKFRIPLILGRFEYQDGGIMDNTHFRWYTFKSGRLLLEAHGFRVIRAYASGHFPMPFIRRLVPSAIQRWIDHAATSFSPGFFGLQLIYVAVKD